jgi:hypothetical protein
MLRASNHGGWTVLVGASAAATKRATKVRSGAVRSDGHNMARFFEPFGQTEI